MNSISKNLLPKMILTLSLVAIPAMGATSNLKIGYVDMQKALQSVDAGKDIQAILDKERTKKRKEMEKLHKKLQKEAKAFEKKAASDVVQMYSSMNICLEI